ncbi:MAG: EAL domain-containing protein [Methyloceanibacter sp.]|nr:EAL domain-containing protein [Methyloceanibacter sp.]
MLDLVVLIAMAVTAAAFAVGLIVHSGIAQIPALIAAASLYMVMAASYLMVARSTRSAPVTDRLNELEEALEIIDGDLQRIDRVEDDVARLDLLNDRVERLDQAVADYGSNETVGGLARFDQFASEFEEVHTKIEGLRADLEGEARSQRDKIAGDLRALEGVIKQLSRDMAVASAAAAVAREGPAAAPARSAPIAKPEMRNEPLATVPGEALTVFEVEEDEIVELAGLDDDVVPRAEESATAGAHERVGDDEMLEIIAHAIEEGRVDLYLQPTVTLPERRPRFYEAFTRIRTKSDQLILPAAFLPVAEGSGMMPLIDNVLLVKSVQVLRRLSADSRIKGIFCNISVQTLLDPEFFPELVEFMEENSSLSESLTFEVSQAAILGLGAAELGSLDTLGALGYGFCLDHVTELDVDFARLRDRHFRFVKVAAKAFLRDVEERGAGLPGADMKSYLETFGLTLIVEKVEDESSVAKLLDHGVALAQGHLFGEPKPMGPALSRELEDADAA